jgi:hypothetical protein
MYLVNAVINEQRLSIEFFIVFDSDDVVIIIGVKLIWAKCVSIEGCRCQISL